ncbi:MAG TPA: methylenetetrahydrofolate reductase C-terminal domain-containing protein [bacterium]|nr:methylenetetrahydrofolate reductase C-terminal domain-containing protein [bacterium]HOL35852.1 methylenetetrahydrofolate reductase C-terminal domain-containing protein [bacterium]HPP09297.1 methylenetetrahydrofolate reductase C-terminal domain-containing protein [bacterium]
MLITKPKDSREIESYFEKRVFVFKCYGCREVYFPEQEINKFVEERAKSISGIAEVDYLCNESFSKIYIEKNAHVIRNSDVIVVFSCGVGSQVISKLMENNIVVPGCDTCYLNGFQGLTVLDCDCNQCGECYLNYTGGICPITSCAKNLLNGPCGGAKNNKCEVNPEVDCGWIAIYERLMKINKEKILVENKIFVRNFEKIIKGK